MSNKKIATIMLIVGALFILVPMVVYGTDAPFTGLAKSLTIFGAGCEIVAGVFYKRSRHESDEDDK